MMTQEMKDSRKAQRQLQAISRKMALASKLRVGAFVKNVWGATMQSVSYWEIVAIKKNRVSLRRARTEGDSRPNCGSSEVKLIGSYFNGEATHFATVRSGYLFQEGKGSSDHWSTYEFCEIGDKTSCWSD